MLGEVKPDLLICDLRLPGVNGFQIVRAVSDMQKLRALDIVVISGLPVPEINAHGGLPERVHMMGKPIDFEKLKNIVLSCSRRKLLGSHPA
jgi:CheY-like chemotaxis protein